MAYNKTWLLLLLAFATQCSGVGIDIITSGNDAKDAGDATVRYLDPLGDLALEGVRAGQPIPDLVSPTYLITSDSTFRNVRCQTLYVQGNCRLRVIGGLEIDRILPMPNSSVPPTLHIFDAGASVSTFAADFSKIGRAHV